MKLKTFFLSFLPILAICGLLIVTLDKPLAIYFKNIFSGNWEKGWTVITDAGRGGWWYGLAILGYLYCQWNTGRPLAAEVHMKFNAAARSFLFMLSAMLVSGGVMLVAKVVIGRYRPRYFFEDGLYGFEPFNMDTAMNSLPSGHAQLIWSAMVALMLLFPRLAIPCLLTAIVISFSRCVVTAHYLSDVVMGGYVGTIVTLWVRDWFEGNGKTVRIS